MSMFGRQTHGSANRAQPVIQPVSMWQKFILDQDIDPECTPDMRQMWVLSHVTLVKPKLDLRRLKRALEKVFARHDSLRIRFDWIKGQWRAIIAPPGPVEIVEIDARDLDPAGFEAAVVEAANQPMPLIDAPMAEIVLVIGGAHGDAVIARVHHAISDGFGMVVLFEDLFKFLIGLPILEPAISHGEYVAKYQSPPPERAAEIAAFWEEMHRDFPPAPKIGRLAKGQESLPTLLGKRERRIFEVTMKKGSDARLEALSLKLNVPVPTLMFAAHFQALCECYDTDRIAFLSHVTRSDPRLGTFMGDHTMDAVLIHQRVERADFEASAVRLGETYMRVMAHLPSEAARLGSDYWNRLIDAGGRPSQFSAYQPRAVAREERSLIRESFRSPAGTEFKVGPYTLSSIDARRSTRISFDIQLVVDPLVHGSFSLPHDALSIEKHEITRSADVMCDLLGVDIGEATFS